VDTYRKERFRIVEAEKMEDKIIKIECVNIGNCGSISLGIEYDAIENDKGFRLLSDYNYPKDYFKKVDQQEEKENPNKIDYKKEYIEQKEKNKNFLNLLQIDIDNLKEDNKKLENTRDALVKANNELKEENESLGKERKLLERQLENELSRNHVVMKKNEELERENLGLKDKLETIDNEYQEEIKELNARIKRGVEGNRELKEELDRAEQEAKKKIDSLMLLNDRYMEKQKKMESDLIKYEDTIKKQKETIKALASLL
jgi:FtsZ-binding cell division protein ZapB